MTNLIQRAPVLQVRTPPFVGALTTRIHIRQKQQKLKLKRDGFYLKGNKKIILIYKRNKMYFVNCCSIKTKSTKTKSTNIFSE